MTSILLSALFGIMIPKMLIKDLYNLREDERNCAISDTLQLLENPIERKLIMQIVIDDKRDQKIYASAYTLWGLKYATVELSCGQRASVIWRRWFGK